MQGVNLTVPELAPSRTREFVLIPHISHSSFEHWMRVINSSVNNSNHHPCSSIFSFYLVSVWIILDKDHFCCFIIAQMKLLSWVNLFDSWVSGKCLKFAKRKVSCSEPFHSWCSVHNNVVVNQCPFSVLIFFIFNDDRNFITLIFSASFHDRSHERVSFSKSVLVLFMSEKSMKE